MFERAVLDNVPGSCKWIVELGSEILLERFAVMELRISRGRNAPVREPTSRVMNVSNAELVVVNVWGDD